MKDSEKQIAWANKIIARLDGVMDDIIANIPDRYNAEQKAAMASYMEDIRQRIHGADYAGDVIDLFKDVKTPEDFMGMWRVRFANTPGQHKILGR